MKNNADKKSLSLSFLRIGTLYSESAYFANCANDGGNADCVNAHATGNLENLVISYKRTYTDSTTGDIKTGDFQDDFTQNCFVESRTFDKDKDGNRFEVIRYTVEPTEKQLENNPKAKAYRKVFVVSKRIRDAIEDDDGAEF